MSKIKPIAFYLPQFHPVRENSEWWGPGFTEWTNVAKAKPNFVGHYQPHVPRDLGFYDLRIVDTIRQQAEYAALYGVHGFCFYYYWFNGRRILELPLNNFLASDIEFPFCVCWANENWTRTWDGQEKDVLLEQIHTEEEDRHFIEDLIPILKDRRAIKVDGKPMLLVYRADLFPDSKATVSRWREIARKHGIPDLHLCAVQFYGIEDPRVWGFDAAVEFPPHTFIGPENRPDKFPQLLNEKFVGGLIDYRKIIAQSMERTTKDYLWYRGIIPSWDNTARRENNPHTIIYSSPDLYRFWLHQLVQFTKENNGDEHQFLFVNAWNEWGEGCHLEPDLKHGLAYLEATKAAVDEIDDTRRILMSDPKLARAVGEDGLAELLDQRADLERDVVLVAAQSRHRMVREETAAARRLKLKVGGVLARYPRLYRAAARLYRAVR
ncbi:glycosyltransferase WbsX family protein [Burkholderia vietnamiensis]|uniref:glycosyltransferase WbsX family protein n=1 Tax=Burkholderia vietnamiensis TaxID=60552 RepID=UPI0026508799|nr:glycoside hydrolase family 99-like domain-containing protein [Burkholderia vietnamiensis]MDN8045312.1 glycoside hydrolase family 99-like domain-containing protein [Burkholderia vietnamiensis]